MRRLNRGARVLLVLGMASVLSGPTRSQNSLGECGIDFDDASAIAALSNDARETFAWEPYRQTCGNHIVNVEALTHGHVHLSFEDQTIDCYGWIGPGNAFAAGKSTGSNCTAVDWVNEPREMHSHQQGHWIRIWMEDANSHQPRPFDITRIHVGPGHPIQLWFRTQDGTWWCWSDLDDAETWKIGKWVKNVTEVRIRGAATGPGPYLIRNFMAKE